MAKECYGKLTLGRNNKHILAFAALNGLLLILLHSAIDRIEAQDGITSTETSNSSYSPLVDEQSSIDYGLESHKLKLDENFCGRRYTKNNGDKSSRIIYGMYSKFHWPWAARFQIKTSKGTNVICNGALINDRWVITASHCVHESSPEDVTVILGVMDFNKKFNSDNAYAAIEIVAHPEYVSSRLKNDLALIKLDRKVPITKYVHPICLPSTSIDTYSYAKNKVCYQTGWGKTEDGKTSKRLKELRVVVASPDVCNTGKDRSVRLNPHGNICIAPYSPPGKKVIGAVCMGDSGGPAACLDSKENRWYLVGTVSYGPKECVDSERDTWATVSSDLSQFRDWITLTISDNF